MKKGFTLVELLVVVGMIALLTGAIGNSMSEARKRAQVAKATAEVKELTNAFLAYENYEHNYELPALDGQETSRSTLSMLLGGDGTTPVLFNGSFRGTDGYLMDPWGHPYRITIRQKAITPARGQSYGTGYYLPNQYRIVVEEEGN